MKEGELYFERLPTCQYGVPDYSRPSYESDCREPATYRVTWDGGKTWLYLCPDHAAKVEIADAAPEPGE